MSESELPTRTRLWHAAYVRWYDHHVAQHHIRARVWGWVADALCPSGASEWNQ